MCPFCNSGVQEVLQEKEHAYIMRSNFPYDLWEWRDVEDHLLVIPRRHVTSLNELRPEEQAEIIALAAKYEHEGYDVYARATGSVQRTVPLHQHTHLLKTSKKNAKYGVYLAKPYFLKKV